jgi:hypothetical protein
MAADTRFVGGRHNLLSPKFFEKLCRINFD